MKKLTLICFILFIGCTHKVAKKTEARKPASIAAPTQAQQFFESIEKAPARRY